MADINFSQLLANTAASLTCCAILFGFMAKYAKSIGRGEIDAKLAAFKKDEFTPALERMDAHVQEIARLSGRLGGVEIEVKSLREATGDLAETITQNAIQGRSDLTGLGTRIENSNKTQTELLVELIKANKK